MGHGWLVKVAHPLPTDSLEPGSGGKLERELLGLLPWAESVAEAIAQARREKKLVLAVVRSHYTADGTTFLEQMLMVAILMWRPRGLYAVTSR